MRFVSSLDSLRADETHSWDVKHETLTPDRWEVVVEEEEAQQDGMR
jgi:hypothetical protein